MKFYNPVQIELGHGIRNNIYQQLKSNNTLVFCSNSFLKRHKKDPLLENLLNLRNICFEHSFTNNPSLEEMKIISEKYSKKSIDSIVGIGGGSAMDVAKISSISIEAFKKGVTIENILEDIKEIDNIKNIDLFLVPTTAGTGSEVTPFATIWDYDAGIKKSLSSSKMFAKKAFIDPDFIRTIPFDDAFSTCLDALNQALESIWNKNSNSLTNSIASSAVIKSLNAFKHLHEIKTNKDVRLEFVIASLFAGIAISHTRTALCHSISYPITISLGLSHGYACAFSMIEVMKYNLPKIENQIKKIENTIQKNIINSIEEMYENYNFYSIIRSKIKRKEDVFLLLDRMVTTGRADNNIVDIDINNLKEIIERSCNNASIS